MARTWFSCEMPSKKQIESRILLFPDPFSPVIALKSGSKSLISVRRAYDLNPSSSMLFMYIFCWRFRFLFFKTLKSTFWIKDYKSGVVRWNWGFARVGGKFKISSGRQFFKNNSKSPLLAVLIKDNSLAATVSLKKKVDFEAFRKASSSVLESEAK